MTLVLLVVVAAAVGGFVGGVLFGRRNTKKVELALADVKAAALKAGVKL
jgi:uncharacterized protein YneF (UPF0154 family)